MPITTRTHAETVLRKPSNFEARDLTRFRVGLAISLATIAATRLPQLASPHLLPDPDESVVGVMSLLMDRGEAYPVFMLGRTHGLSMLEAAATALLSGPLGPTPLAMKLAMLVLWTVGAFFLVLAVREFHGVRAATLAALLISTAPAWAVWSMKARGGYITAFLFSGLTLWLIARAQRRIERSPLLFAGMGAGAALVLLAQPFFFLALLPFLLLLASRQRMGGLSIALTSGVATTAVVLAVGTRAASGARVPGIVDHESDLIQLPERLWIALSGGYYFFVKVTPGPWTAMAATLWSLGLAAVVLVGLWTMVRSGRYTILQACLLAIVGLGMVTFAVRTRSDGFPYRYLLPLPGVLVLAFSHYLSEAAHASGRWRAAFLIGLLLLYFSGTAALIEFGGVSMAGRRPGPVAAVAVPEVAALRAVIHTLRSDGIAHVYTMEAGLQWSLMHLSGGELVARWTDPRDRYPRFPQEVDRALYAGQPIALVGHLSSWERVREGTRRSGESLTTPTVVHGQFFVLQRPPLALLRDLGFRFDPESGR